MQKLLPFSRLFLGITLILIACPAFADIGMPMVFITFPYMLIALIPIILIEGYVLLRMLLISRKQAFICTAVSNSISTIVGIPLAWLCLVIIEMSTGGGYAYGINSWLKKLLAVTWQAPWLVPYGKELSWMIPAATMVLLVPFFFISWHIEYIITARILNKSVEIQRKNIKNAVYYGNLLTYALLEFVTLTFLLYALIK